MAEIKAEVKKWGNSLGIRVPADLAHREGIEAGDVVRVRIDKWTRPAPGSFGAGRRHAAKYEDYLRIRKTEARRDEALRERRLGIR